MEINRLKQLAGINEIKISKPGTFNKMSLELFKQIMRNGFEEMINDLHFQNIDEAMSDFDNKLMGINEKFQFVSKLNSFLDDYGFGGEQLEMMICNNIIK
jgi:hypothetical protein